MCASRATRRYDADASTPLPWGCVGAVFLAQLAQGVQLNSLFPLLVFMVRDWQVAAGSLDADVSDPSVARQAGLLASCYPFGLFVAGFFWGRVLDTWGRKPVLLVGAFGAALASVLLGLAPNYRVAIGVRLLAGCANFISPSLRCIIAEITDASNQARAMSYISLAWNLGTAMGPVLSGMLDGAIAAYPYLAPCAASGALSFVSGVVALIALPETLSSKRTRSHQDATEGETDCEAKGLLSLESDDSADTPAEDANLETDYALRGLTKLQGSSASLVPLGARDSSAGGANARSGATAAADGGTTEVWWKFQGVLPALLSYMLIAAVYIWLDEMFPVFAAADREYGGLGLSTRTISIVLSTGGAVVFVFTLTSIPRLTKRFGAVGMLRGGFVLSSLAATLLPFPSLLPEGAPRWALISLLCLCQALTRMSGTVVFSAIILLMANAVDSQYLGRLNGTGQSMASFARTFGPTVGGLVWAQAEAAAASKAVPVPQLWAFALIGVLCATLGSVVSSRVPRDFDVPHRERVEKRRGAIAGEDDEELPLDGLL